MPLICGGGGGGKIKSWGCNLKRKQQSSVEGWRETSCCLPVNCGLWERMFSARQWPQTLNIYYLKPQWIQGPPRNKKGKKKKSKLQKNNLNFNNFEGSSLSQCHSHICQHSSHNTQLIICIFQMCLLKQKKMNLIFILMFSVSTTKMFNYIFWDLCCKIIKQEKVHRECKSRFSRGGKEWQTASN